MDVVGDSLDEFKEAFRVLGYHLRVLVAGNLDKRVKWVGLVEDTLPTSLLEYDLHRLPVHEFASL